MSDIADIRVADVTTTAGTQSRAAISETTVADYAEKMQAGEVFPPIVLFHDGSTYWLADGFHRVMGATRSGLEWIAADVRKGTKRDAILYSVGTNGAHGLPRTNADKRHAVMLLLNDEEWRVWSDREIARRCAVGPDIVGNLRRSLSSADSEKPAAKTFTNKHGQTATMNTENIGKRGQPGTKADKTARIAEFAAEGYRSSQIAKRVDLDEKTVRLYASEAGISLPDAVIGKTARIDHRRVAEQTVLSMEACAQSIATLPIDFTGLESRDLQEWLASVTDSLSIFRKFHTQIKEATHG